MTLRLALKIDGDAQGATIALDKTVAGIRAGTVALGDETVAAGAAAAAMAKHGSAAAFSGAQIAEAGHVARSIVGSLSAGASPLQAISVEMNRIISIATIGPGGPAGAIAAIGDAVLGLVSPAGLAAVAIAGIAAASLIWLTQTRGETLDATAALKEHKEWLDQVLSGYDKTKSAADNYLASAKQLPEGAVKSDIQAQLSGSTLLSQSAEGDLQKALAQVKQFRDEVVTDLTQPIEQFGSVAAGQAVQQVIDGLDKAGLSASSSKDDYKDLIATITELKNTAPPIEAEIAASLLPIIQNAQAAAASVGALQIAEDSLPHSVLSVIKVEVQGFEDAQKTLLSLAPDLRDQFTKLRDEAGQAYSQAAGSASDSILRDVAKSNYDYVRSQIDAAQKADQAKHVGSTAAPKRVFDPADAGQKDVAQLQEEQQALGLSTGATAALNEQLKLENDARRDAIGLTPQRLTAIQQEAAAVGAETAKYDALNTVYQQGQGFFETLFFSIKENTDAGQNALQAFANGAVTALGQIESKALQMSADGIWNLIWGGGSSGGTNGGGLGSWLASLFTGGASADAASALAWAAPAFAGGGYTGDGGIGDAAGVVHGKEFVVNAPATSRHRSLLEAINGGMPGYAAGGFVRSLGGGSSAASQSSAPATTPVIFQNSYDFRGSSLTEAQVDAKVQAAQQATVKQMGPAYRFFATHSGRTEFG